jgi:hypothetical protein
MQPRVAVRGMSIAIVHTSRTNPIHGARDYHDRPVDPRTGDLRHLREQGLVEIVRVAGNLAGEYARLSVRNSGV